MRFDRYFYTAVGIAALTLVSLLPIPLPLQTTAGACTGLFMFWCLYMGFLRHE